MKKDEVMTSVPNVMPAGQMPVYPTAINVNPTIIVNVSNDTDSTVRSRSDHSHSADADIANALVSGIAGIVKLLAVY